jgi:hypothetical protein
VRAHPCSPSVLISHLCEQVYTRRCMPQTSQNSLMSVRVEGLQSKSDETEYTADQLWGVSIKSHCIYEHSTRRILYTTYDH